MKTKNYYCFEIAFPSAKLDDDLAPDSDCVAPLHHAHLFPDGDNIEIRIFFNSQTQFGDNLARWAYGADWNAFGTLIHSEKESQNDGLLRLDFSESRLLGIRIGSNQFEGNSQYVSLSIDTVRYYTIPDHSQLNRGEFYLGESGFRVVKAFYASLFGFGQDGDFKIRRMDGMDEFYEIGNSKFRPEFHFVALGNVNEKEDKIIKEPKIQFEYGSDVTEVEIFRLSEIVRSLISFYSHSNVEYITSRVHLKDHTITTKQVPKQMNLKSSGSLRAFGNHFRWPNFLESNWQHLLSDDNSRKLAKLIDLFLQSLVVDGSSKFLICWTIIEICSKTKMTEEKFVTTLNKKLAKSKYKDALRILLETIGPEDHIEFSKKWEGISNKLQFKPMKSPLEEFFVRQGLDPKGWPMSIGELKSIRDKIVHGSLNEVPINDLERANLLLYRIAGILILSFLGIEEWELDLALK